MRTEAEIRDQRDDATDVAAQGESRWPGMSYEEGVEAALGWALGDTDEAPMSNE